MRLRGFFGECLDMDQGTKRFLWLIASALGQCELSDPQARAELQAMARRLKEISGGIPDELSSERLTEACQRARR